MFCTAVEILKLKFGPHVIHDLIGVDVKIKAHFPLLDLVNRNM